MGLFTYSFEEYWLCVGVVVVLVDAACEQSSDVSSNEFNWWSKIE